MDDRVSMVGMVLDMAFTLGPADACRVVDAIMEARGPMAPVPAFEDVRADAEAWVAMADETTLTIFLVAIWSAWPAEKQKQCIKWLQENVKESEN